MYIWGYELHNIVKLCHWQSFYGGFIFFFTKTMKRKFKKITRDYTTGWNKLETGGFFFLFPTHSFLRYREVLAVSVNPRHGPWCHLLAGTWLTFLSLPQIALCRREDVTSELGAKITAQVRTSSPFMPAIINFNRNWQAGNAKIFPALKHLQATVELCGAL